jgi:hypothetical protein
MVDASSRTLRRGPPDIVWAAYPRRFRAAGIRIETASIRAAAFADRIRDGTSSWRHVRAGAVRDSGEQRTMGNRRGALPTLVVVIAVAALVVGVLAIGVLPGVTAPAAPAATPTAAAGGPVPSAMPAGTYASQVFKPTLTYTVPDGWLVGADSTPYFQLLPATSDVVGIHLFRDAKAASQDPACPDTPAAGVGSSAKELVEWIRGRPGLIVNEPIPSTVGGLSGQQILVAIKDGWTASCPFANGTPTVPLLVEGTGGYRWVVAGNEKLRLDILEAPGGGTVIVDVDAFDGTLMDQLVTLATPIVDSFSFARS